VLAGLRAKTRTNLSRDVVMKWLVCECEGSHAWGRRMESASAGAGAHVLVRVHNTACVICGSWRVCACACLYVLVL
jgi:hypothetical protein